MVVDEVDVGAVARRAARVDAVFLQGPGFFQGTDEGVRVAGVLHGAGVRHFFAAAREGGLQQAAIEVEDGAEDGEGGGAEVVAEAIVAAQEAAQIEELGFGGGVDTLLAVWPVADDVVAMHHRGEAGVNGEVAVFDVAVFVPNDGLQFVAGEAVYRALADGEGEAAVCTADDEGVDAVVVALDVGSGYGVAGCGAHFSDKVGVEAVGAVFFRAGGFGTERARLLVGARCAHFALHVGVSDEQRSGGEEAGDEADVEVEAAEGVRAVVQGSDDGAHAEEGERAGKAVGEVARERAQPEGYLQAAASDVRLLVFFAKEGRHQSNFTCTGARLVSMSSISSRLLARKAKMPAMMLAGNCCTALL